MLRIFLTLTLLNIGLFASYSNVLNYYKNGKYKQAIQEAKASKKEYSNPNLHLIWAYSAKSLGYWEEEMLALERVLILDKDHTQAQHELKLVYQRTHRNELSESSDPYTLSGRGLPPLLRERGTIPFKTKVSVSIGHDNNLNATPGNLVLSDYFGTDTNTTQLSSLFTRATSQISYTNKFGNNEKWYIKAVIDTYIQSNFSAHYYDLSTGSLELGLGYTQKDYDIYLPFSYYRVNYLDKDLLEHYRFLPQLLIPIGEDIILDINALYSENNYIVSVDKTKDDTTVGVGFGAYYLFGKHFAYLSTKYEHRSTQHANASKYITANFFTLSTGIHYYFTPSFLGTFDYRFRYGRYNDTVGTSSTKRDDNYHQFNTKISYSFSKNSELFIADTYTENHSNYAPSVFNKHSTVLGVSLKY